MGEDFDLQEISKKKIDVNEPENGERGRDERLVLGAGIEMHHKKHQAGQCQDDGLLARRNEKDKEGPKDKPHGAVHRNVLFLDEPQKFIQPYRAEDLHHGEKKPERRREIRKKSHGDKNRRNDESFLERFFHRHLISPSRERLRRQTGAPFSDKRRRLWRILRK